jgi:hypothetical protein
MIPGRTSISCPSWKKKGAPPHGSFNTLLSPLKGDLTYPQNTGENTATGDATFKVLHLRARLIDIKRTDHDEFGVRSEVSNGDGDLCHDVLVDSVNVVFELGGNGDNRCRVGDGPCLRQPGGPMGAETIPNCELTEKAKGGEETQS